MLDHIFKATDFDDLRSRIFENADILYEAQYGRKNPNFSLEILNFRFTCYHKNGDMFHSRIEILTNGESYFPSKLLKPLGFENYFGNGPINGPYSGYYEFDANLFPNLKMMSILRSL